MDSSGEQIEQFVLLAKGASGGGVTEVIKKATEQPNLYAFGEQLDLPSVQALANDAQFKPYYDLLNIFAFGTWADFQSQRASLPELSQAQVQKLKYLTLLTLAEHSGKQPLVSYEHLFSALAVDNVRALEDLVINCMYSGILQVICLSCCERPV